MSVRKTPAGTEYWENTPADMPLYRETNIRWLIRSFERRQLTLKAHVARQFTELYAKVSFLPLLTLIHAVNNFWFKHIKIPHLVFGQIIIFQKAGRKGHASYLAGDAA